MDHILVIGAGKIGSLIAFLLANSSDYFVHLADMQPTIHLKKLAACPNLQFVTLDASDSNAISDYLGKHPIKAIASSLPFYCNIPIAKIAAALNLHYFDLTEDIQTTQAVQEIAQHTQSAF